MTPTTTRPRPAGAAAGRSRTPIDPRISARRTAVTRQQGKRRLRLLMVLAIVTALVVGLWFLAHSVLFSARNITVVGATHETAVQIEQAGGLTMQTPLLNVHDGAVAAGIEQLPWVLSATVSVHWPDSVHIVVTEQSPALTMNTASGQWAALSASGRVLAVSAQRPAGLPLVTGPLAPGAPGTVVGAGDQVGLRVASTLPASFKAQVTAVHIEPGGWVQLAMTTPITVNIGTATQLPAKYEDVTSLLAHATLHTGDVLDVSVPDAPTVTGG
ncbi:MAG TPA: FtsQ-type POTRA domain-containing protein [Acidimicrobiales bacterium]|jgi:cell division protein FtsQ|nr:FtsQ-type POTRA domain-containing protein [Acidimicrobiales bacterium]